MMEHIRQFDWCTSENDPHFVKEDDLDNCVIERLIRNKFYNPLISLEDGDDENSMPIDWGDVFNNKNKNSNNRNERINRMYIPGMKAMPLYPKQSSLSFQDQFRCLKVLCSKHPNLLPDLYIARPTPMDYRVFDQVKEIYEKERKEYTDWARNLWTTQDCVKALRPKPIIEMVYEAEFKLRERVAQTLPKDYFMAAQIQLSKEGSYELSHKEDLIKVDIDTLPKVVCPEVLTKMITVLRACSVPEPCQKHPCKFIMPNESSVSILPLTEIHKELAQYAVDRGASHIAGEGALKCLLETNRNWTIPVSVCEGIKPDGEKVRVTVLGCEFSLQKEGPLHRTYRAYKNMIYDFFIPPSEKEKIIDALLSSDNEEELDNTIDIEEDSSDEEDNRLLIDVQNEIKNEKLQSDSEENIQTDKQDESSDEDNIATSPARKRPRLDTNIELGVYTCACKDTMFEKPPPRSFRLWQVKDNNSEESHNIIIHCAHKTKTESNQGSREILLEPIPEYQIELGGTVPLPQKMNSLALSLMLRNNAELVNVRMEAATGTVVTIERQNKGHLLSEESRAHIASVLHAALQQLSGLLVGEYLLVHEKNHGTNALLYSSRGGGERLSVCGEETPLDESQCVKEPPNIGPVLLPYHKFRKILPCAFSPNEPPQSKFQNKRVTRQKTPPQALKQEDGGRGSRGKWPNKKRGKNKRKY